MLLFRLGLLLTFLFVASPVCGQVVYLKEDRATVKIMAVVGVVQREVEPPKSAHGKKKLSIAVVEGGHGSGVIVSKNGVIITAAHVVANAEFVAVKLPGAKHALMAEVLYENKKHDVAFLKVPGTFQDYVPLPTSPPMLTVRSKVYSLGYPLDGTRSHPQSNAGVVAGQLENGNLQLGLAVNPGNSGGPLIDEQGNLVGIVSARFDPLQGAQSIAIAVPMTSVLKFFNRRVRGSPRLVASKEAVAEISQASAAADVVARIAEVTSLGAAIEHIEEENASFKLSLRAARQTHAQDPDFLALLSAHYWNESVVRFALDGRNWRGPLKKSGQFARRAVKIEKRVLNRSPFLYAATGKKGASRSKKFRGSAPRGIAGFRLGWDLAEGRDACEIEGLEFSKNPRGYVCAEPPTVGELSGPVEFRLCEGEICQIDVIDRPSRALSRRWVNRFQETYEEFKTRFGTHSGKDVHVPRQCKKNLLACLETGTARATYKWAWNRRSLTLTLGRLKGEPTLRISLIDKPRRAKKKRSNARKSSKRRGSPRLRPNLKARPSGSKGKAVRSRE